MTPEQLHAELDARRRELGLKWWQADVSASALERLRNGVVGDRTRERLAAWLRRRQTPPRKE
ncbi:hypothetical protein ACQEVF_25145 [Nonomuraea polychroma]|uniref:hypothetical protein n=1 Tax=Nonomuraea polychroma TaxID=46176 RepID=UPI003D906D42